MILNYFKSLIYLLKVFLIALYLGASVLFFAPELACAQVLTSGEDESNIWVRSLETLRDLDYESWQVVAYIKPEENSLAVLRIVGFPGKLRLDHPTNLNVRSGRYEWSLEDITLANPQLANDKREAAVEFDISPLITSLHNNRPLRMELKGTFSELPIPPYLVAEWRSLIENKETN